MASCKRQIASEKNDVKKKNLLLHNIVILEYEFTLVSYDKFRTFE